MPLLVLLLALQDVKTIRRCKQRIFDLHAAGQLQAWVDLSHGYAGVEQVADAVEYMLQGGHVGKVVIPILPVPSQ
jgi:NADPH-dependent curcumin reductase CurA